MHVLYACLDPDHQPQQICSVFVPSGMEMIWRTAHLQSDMSLHICGHTDVIPAAGIGADAYLRGRSDESTLPIRPIPN